MFKFISKFPFFKIEDNGYERIVIEERPKTKRQSDLVKKVKAVLSESRIPLNKIRFIFEPTFLYDIDANKINPVYTIMMPKNPGRKKKPIIEVDKPANCFTIKFSEFVDIDDAETIKPVVMSSKRGVVMYIDEKNFNFNYSVGAVNLDASIAFHQQILENFEYNS